MLAGGTGDQNLSPPIVIDGKADDMLSRVRRMLVFSVENRGKKVDPSCGQSKAEVMMERWKDVFSKYDSVGSGTLGLGDIKRMIRRDLKIAERQVPDEQIHAFFEYIDLDKDNKVTFAEFLNFVQQPSTRGTVSAEDAITSVARSVRLCLRRNKINVNNVGEKFRSFDDSGNNSAGEVGPNKMIRFFRLGLGLSKHDCPDKAINVVFSTMDEDATGKITVDELVEFIKYCSLNSTERAAPTRVPRLIGGMSKELPARLPSRRPGTFLGVPLSQVPFCLNGREVESAGRLAQTTTTMLSRPSSQQSLRQTRMHQGTFTVSKQLSSTSIREPQEMGSQAGDANETPRLASAGMPHSGNRENARKKKVWSGHLPSNNHGGYQVLKGGEALNQIEERLFEAGIDVRGHYHTLGRIRVQSNKIAWS
jgi:Ca2+-binding EF-hand superfamily protein